ncbi:MULTISPECIES: sugar ABC transporter substrate-binding protein [Thermomonosporaceae]|uniref:sugar ABC transporter substrate-binding protein n=1 Tax=Thermomonosporaceae TaxID=2012 RepID=UPI00255AF154|nr:MULTISPECIES: substrate-binding domain-containing protein [Thermomonosporaceae]MDL4775264.1 substrate-binding domain-containing protein [Actinomadura xylanilytica]
MQAKLRTPVTTLAAGALCLVLAACGGGNGGNAEADGGAVAPAAAKAAIADAEAAYAKYTKRQPAAPVPALPSPAPGGKRLAIVTCSIPVCITLSGGAEAAARKLGWTVTTLQSNSTPQGFVSVMDQVAADPPDALAYIGAVPDSSIRPQLAKLQAAGTKITEIAPLTAALTPNGPVQAVVFGQKDATLTGTLMGQTVVADANGPAKSVFVWDPSFAGSWGPIKDAYRKALTGAGGSAGVLEVSNANIGKTVPGQIVSYLQAHPDTEYVALAVVDYTAGLDAALRAAGLTGKVKILTRAADTASLKAVQAGTQWASIGLELGAAGYRAVDQLIRLMTGVPLGDRADAPGWQQIYVKGNVTQTSDMPEPPDYAQTYYAAWRVG